MCVPLRGGGEGRRSLALGIGCSEFIDDCCDNCDGCVDCCN